jgi:flagellar M-ring protein FliF
VALSGAGVPTAATGGFLGRLPDMLPLGGLSSMRDMWRQPAVRRAMPAILALLTLMIFGALYLWMQSPPWRQLLPGVSEVDRQSALEALKTGRFDVRVNKDNGTLEVPAARYHEARMLLAAQGLPKGAVTGGLDMLKDQNSMTTSQFMEQVRYTAAIEQELARSVMTISTIKSARVHLAMPRQSPFIRERIAPKASVVVTPQQGRMVSPAQVKAIVQLVSSSVPYLPAENVSVVDDEGNLITDAPGEAAMGLTFAQLQHKRQVEREYRTRVMQILSPVVGEANLRAQVDIRMDFTQQETTIEDFDRNKDGPKARSEVLAEERSFRPDAIGIPGALSNQPPPDANFSTQTGATPEPVPSGGTFSKRSTRNFEIDRTVRHVKNPVGTIERVSVAVVIHDPQIGAQEGQANGRFTEAEIQRLSNLVRGAIGFDSGRGDVVTLVPAKFEPVAAAGPPVAWYESETLIGAIKSGLAALVFISILFFVVRPVMRAFLPQPVKVPVTDPKMLPPGADPAAIAALAAGGAGGAGAVAGQLPAPGTPGSVDPGKAEGAEGQEKQDETKAEDESKDEDEEELEEGMIRLEEGETLESIKAKLKPKKSAISADLLDTANTYDDKVAIIRMLVAEDSGRVASVLKNMVKP